MMQCTIETYSPRTISETRGKPAPVTQTRIDPYVKQLLQHVFVGTRGGLNRIRIIALLKKESLNLNQLTKKMCMDYKAVQHHVEVLEKNNLVFHIGEKYGRTFFISNLLEVNMTTFNEIFLKMNEKVV